MDCCGSGKPDKKEEKTNAKNTNQVEAEGKEHSHGGCCGGGSGKGMWLHLVLMVILFAVIWYFTRN